jgi:hypothetical protein
MSKTALKKELSKLSKEALINQILDLYDKNSSVKEYYRFFLNPTNEKELAEKYKKLIRKEFNVENPIRSTEKFSTAKKAISDFKNLDPSPACLADVILYLPESACELTALYGDYPEQFYNGAYNNFKTALEFLRKHQLLAEFKPRVKQCLTWASNCGYGFADDISDVYFDYYSD